jgi:exonuclease VII small subunit
MSTDSKDNGDITFDTAVNELEGIASRLERGDLPG